MSEYGSYGEGSGEQGPGGADGHGPGNGAPFDITPGDDMLASPEPHKVRRGPILLTMVAVIVLVLAAGAVALVRNNNESPGALTKLVPASAYGYAQLDLKESASGGLFHYLSHFPGAPGTKPGASKSSFRTTLLTTVFSDSASLNYSRDVQPWLGDSAGVAIFPGADKKPVPLVLLASTDAAKAKAGLDRIRQTDSSFAYDIIGSDVVLAQKQSDLDDAQTQAKSSALPAAGHYNADIAVLPKGSLVSVWADLDQLTAAMKSDLSTSCAGSGLGSDCSMFGKTGILGSLGGPGSTSGRVAMGVTVDDKVATVTLRSSGHKASASSPVVTDEITNLPSDSTAAIALGDVNKALAGESAALSSLGGLFGAGVMTGLGSVTYGSATSISSASGSAVATAAASMLAMPAMPSTVPSAFPTAFPSAFPSGIASGSPSAFPSSVTDIPLNANTGDPSTLIQREITSVTGLTFPGDFETLLGDRTTIAVGNLPLGPGASPSDLELAIRSHPQDLSKASALAGTLTAKLQARGLAVPLTSTTAGSDLILASSKSYAAKVAAGGKLGSDPQFKAAMGDLSQARFAAYVNLSAVTGSLAATKEKVLTGFKAVGVVGRQDGADSVIQVRLLAG